MTQDQYISNTAKFESRGEEIAARVGENYDTVHAILGIGDEAFEFILELEAAYGEEDTLGLFQEKIIKEAGDILWYIAILCRKYGYIISIDALVSNTEPIPSFAYAVQSLMSAFKKHLFYGKELPHNDIQFWINCIARGIVNITNQPIEPIMDRNYQKLSARYGETFEADKAINKDESVE
jgi:NTP pyrophosphatase (non-canonical NTP hydrolase)